MKRVRVKICGITQREDAVDAVRLGADALGFVFYSASPRAIDIQKAVNIAQSLPPFVSLVGLFVDADSAYVHQVIAEVPLHLLQFHGDETPGYCEQFRRPYIKALRMKPEMDVLSQAELFCSAQGLLLDAYKKGVAGGTGESFDWHRIPVNCPKPIILAGGLTPDNVATAVSIAKPYAVDVSSGVELSPGLKDRKKVEDFIKNVSKR